MFSQKSRNLAPEDFEKEKLEHTPWVEKYRPKNLSDVASQDHAVVVLKRTLESANLPHMLFYGPPGTGKTSTVLALAKELYGPNLVKSRVLELNASDERGISIVRQKVKNFARLIVSNASKEDLEKYPCPPYKIIILDEADSMTSDAQSALRRTMETYSGVTRFCLICNYITRIIDPLASRCSKFRFRPLDNENALRRLQYISERENINLENGALEQVLKIANGDLRKAITFLQSATRLHSQFPNVNGMDGDVEMIDRDINSSSSGEVITTDSIREIAGIVPDDLLESLITVCESKKLDLIIKEVEKIILEGWSSSQLLDQIHDKIILNDSLSATQKNQISKFLFESDKRLSNGSDEHLQVLNLMGKISTVL